MESLRAEAAGDLVCRLVRHGSSGARPPFSRRSGRRWDDAVERGGALARETYQRAIEALRGGDSQLRRGAAQA